MISSYYHHGYAVDRKEAKKIGLTVADPDEELENLLWSVWKDYSLEMKCDIPFNVINEAMNNPDVQKALSSVPILNLPANTPPQIAEQLIIQTAQNIQPSTRNTVEDSVLIASIESARTAEELYNNISILTWRNSDMSLGVNCTVFTSGWKTLETK